MRGKKIGDEIVVELETTINPTGRRVADYVSVKCWAGSHCMLTKGEAKTLAEWLQRAVKEMDR